MNDPECPICNKIEDCRCSEDMYITALKEEIYLNESYQRDISWLQNEIKRLKKENEELKAEIERLRRSNIWDSSICEEENKRLEGEIERLKRLNNEIRTRCEYGFDDCPKIQQQKWKEDEERFGLK